jgi:hypothetical protein
MRRDPAPEGRPRVAQRFSVCVRTNFEVTQWCATVRKSRPGGANDNSPALQRREKWKKRTKSRRDD